MPRICVCSPYCWLSNQSVPKGIADSFCLFNELISHLHSRSLQDNLWILKVSFFKPLHHFSRSIPMTITGFVFLGSMEAFIFVPLMPLLIDQIKVTFLA